MFHEAVNMEPVALQLLRTLLPKQRRHNQTDSNSTVCVGALGVLPGGWPDLFFPLRPTNLSRILRTCNDTVQVSTNKSPVAMSGNCLLELGNL
jgi:hypothetical protein